MNGIMQTAKTLLVKTVVSGSAGLNALETKVVRKKLKKIYQESTD